MEFGYFTLSDNHYPNNPRSANQFVLEIREQAILADQLGMHSAGSASITSTRSASIRVPTCCSPTSRRRRRTSASRRR